MARKGKRAKRKRYYEKLTHNRAIMVDIRKERKERMFGETPARPPTPPKPTDEAQEDQRVIMAIDACMEDKSLTYRGIMGLADANALIEEWKECGEEGVLSFTYQPVDLHECGMITRPYSAKVSVMACFIITIRIFYV